MSRERYSSGALLELRDRVLQMHPYERVSTIIADVMTEHGKAEPAREECVRTAAAFRARGEEFKDVAYAFELAAEVIRKADESAMARALTL